YSQKRFVKNKCLPVLKPFVYNGQLNSANLAEGDIAELLLTFCGGQNYRILICSPEVLGNVEFKLFDTNKNLIFSNKDHDYINYWDFTSNTTQQLVVRVKVPKQEDSGDIKQSGYVSILVGFKE
ncbi:MAG: hypothetical protein DRI94_11025, partial [Bacteroidetes bacterium]